MLELDMLPSEKFENLRNVLSSSGIMFYSLSLWLSSGHTGWNTNHRIKQPWPYVPLIENALQNHIPLSKYWQWTSLTTCRILIKYGDWRLKATAIKTCVSRCIDVSRSQLVKFERVVWDSNRWRNITNVRGFWLAFTCAGKFKPSDCFTEDT